MAYGAKYTLTFSDVYQDTTAQYVATIYKKDYSGDVTEVNGTGNPLTIDTDGSGNDGYRPVISSSATLNLMFYSSDIGEAKWGDNLGNWEAYNNIWNKTGFNIIEFLTADADTFLLEIEKDGNLIWKGYYISTSDTDLFEIEPIVFSLQFSDFALIKSKQYGYDADPIPTPTTLATTSFAAKTGAGNLTFDASTSSGLVIDSTTGGFYRIKNTSATPVTVKFNLTLDCVNALDILDNAYIRGIVSNDATVNVSKLQQDIDLSFANGIVNVSYIATLEQNDGMRFSLVLSNIVPPYTPIGTFTITTNSGVVAETYYKNGEYPIKYYAHEKDTILNILLDSLINSGLGMEIRVNCPYALPTDYNLYIGETYYPEALIPGDISTTYVLKNAFVKSINEYENYYTILEGICSTYGLIAYQKNGYIYVCSYDSLVNDTSRIFNRYSYVDKSLIGSITETDTVIELNSSTFRNIDRSQSVRYMLPVKSIDITNEISKSSNQDNCYLKILERRKTGASTYERFITNWDIWGYGADPVSLETSGVDLRATWFFEYATIATSPYNYVWGAASIAPIATSQDNTKYIQTQKPIDVKKGDFVNLSFSYTWDARLNAGLEPHTRIALVLKYPDPNDTTQDLEFFLDAAGYAFVPTLTYLTNLTDINIKNIKIPVDGRIYLRMLLPWASTTTFGGTPQTNPWMFINYAMIQAFKGSISAYEAEPQTYSTYFSNQKANKNSLSLDSSFYIYDPNRYTSSYDDTTTTNGVTQQSPLKSAYPVTNTLITKFYDPIGFVSPNITNFISQVSSGINNNLGVPSTTIEGSYKSTFYSIGDKFKYTITGFEEKNFVLLDHSSNLKQGEQNVILYSSNFIDTSSLTQTTKLIIE